MLLVLDVGNTHTVVGFYDDGRWIQDWRIHTETRLTDDELNLMISRFFRQAGIGPDQVRQTVVSCVVPPLSGAIESYCVKYLGHRPDWVNHKTVDMPVLLDNPAEVGADRLVNAVAAVCASILSGAHIVRVHDVARARAAATIADAVKNAQQ